MSACFIRPLGLADVCRYQAEPLMNVGRTRVEINLKAGALLSAKLNLTLLRQRVVQQDDVSNTSNQTTSQGETPMLRKTIVAIAAAATIGGTVALSSTDASAHGWGGRGGHFAVHGGGFRHFGGFRGARFFGGGYYPYYAYGDSCWRFVPTRWGGVARAWVC
jgi:hypothetical protein